MAATLILLRHGESEWNALNLSTGWVDVPLSDKGRAEAVNGGKLLAQAAADGKVELPDVVHTSLLRRAINTAALTLDEADRHWIPVKRDWRLNERHYGALQGKNKSETLQKFGEEQFNLWRRSYDVPPPPLPADSPFDFSKDRRYAGAKLPDTESLKTTLDRVQPYWEGEIAPHLKSGETLLVAAHGNSLRAIVKLLFNLSDAAIIDVEVPTGNPLLIELDAALRPRAARYLDEARATKLP